MSSRISMFLALSLVLAASAKAADPEKLKRDLVVIAGDRYTAEQVQVCTSNVGTATKSEQMRVSANAPIAVISRDRFVMMLTFMMTKMTTGKDCKNVDSLIGSADADIVIVIEQAGMQFAVTTDGKTERFTKLWSDL